MADLTVFSVQDETGTVYQFTAPADSPTLVVSVGDTGSYVGIPDEGTDGTVVPASVTDAFVVTQVLNGQQFSVNTLVQKAATWPRTGTITWLTGANANQTTLVTDIDPANAYIDTSFLTKYLNSRGLAIPGTSTTLNMQTAIVAATDYLDQKYRFRGVKLIQNLGSDVTDANAVFLEPWLTPWGLNGMAILSPAITPQETQFPRQGCVDLSGDTVNGIPLTLKKACAELAWRALNGVTLQADFDTSLGGQGGVVSSVTKEIGPIKTVTAYDTKLGLGFFASFPQVDRMLSKAGLLISNAGRTVIR
jgi:hypothetical protein